MNYTKMITHVPTLPTIPARAQEATQWKNSSVLDTPTLKALPVLEDMIRKGYVRPAEDGKLALTEKGALSFFRFCARSTRQLIARATKEAA
ncbi:MAG TPA: hypothetical protein VFP43_12880 [Mesorhizobium sp.]|nr:hypothetical protein [Mesorhizobium sp.]